MLFCVTLEHCKVVIDAPNADTAMLNAKAQYGQSDGASARELTEKEIEGYRKHHQDAIVES